MGANNSQQAVREELREAFTPVAIPRDDEGYVQSFSVDEPEKLHDFFEEYGFVVVSGILDEETCKKTIEEIWSDINQTKKQYTQKQFTPLSPDNPNSWEDNYPISGVGMVGDDIAAGPRAWSNRQHPNVYKAYSAILQTPKLLVSLDRYGFMRPTTQIPFKKILNGEETIIKKDRPDWKTAEKWFHWDLNPWVWCGINPPDDQPEDDLAKRAIIEEKISEFSDPFNAASAFISENNDKNENLGFDKVQGLLVLADSTEKDGGFQTIPGFHKFLPTWAKQIKSHPNESFVYVPQEEKFTDHAQKITAKKGSLIVWSSRMPHCNFPNSGSRFRYCQYVKMFSTVYADLVESELGQARKKALIARQPEEFVVSELGEKLFGLKEWED